MKIRWDMYSCNINLVPPIQKRIQSQDKPHYFYNDVFELNIYILNFNILLYLQ